MSGMLSHDIVPLVPDTGQQHAEREGTHLDKNKKF
jgi:hypothetical protein